MPSAPEDESTAEEEAALASATEKPVAMVGAANDARPPGPKPSAHEGPPADDRALMLAGWSCVGLIAATCLGIYILFASAFSAIDDPTDGMVTLPPEVELEAPENGIFENGGLENGARERVVRAGVQWETDYGAARERAQAADRALLLLFTAEFSTASLDLKDGTFTDPRVVAHVERAFVPVHVDLTEPTTEASAVAERFGVQFTPQIVYVDATTQNRLAMDTTTLVDPDVLLEHLSAAAP